MLEIVHDAMCRMWRWNTTGWHFSGELLGDGVDWKLQLSAPAGGWTAGHLKRAEEFVQQLTEKVYGEMLARDKHDDVSDTHLEHVWVMVGSDAKNEHPEQPAEFSAYQELITKSKPQTKEERRIFQKPRPRAATKE